MEKHSHIWENSKTTTILLLLLPESITATLPWNSNGPTIQNIFTVCGICLQVSYIWLLRLYLPEKIREMTPGVIRLPFWDMMARNSQVFYVCLNQEASSAPEHLKGRSLYLQGDLADILKELRIQLEKEK